jgi:hypothetical protein
MFLKQSPAESLQANDRAARTILELRNAEQEQIIEQIRSKSLDLLIR